MTDTRNELKPCPFCGGEASISDWVTPEGVKYKYDGVNGQIVCKTDGCIMKYNTTFYYIEGEIGSEKIDMIKAWNTRPRPSAEAWQPIETAPRDGLILVYSPKHKEQFVVFLGTNPEDGVKKWVIARGESITFVVSDPTHWMPLPKPPTEETP